MRGFDPIFGAAMIASCVCLLVAIVLMPIAMATGNDFVAVPLIAAMFFVVFALLLLAIDSLLDR